MRDPIISEDCQAALASTAGLWLQLAGRRVFLTGGTGFFGTWFLELATFAADALGFTCEIVVLSRDPARFQASRAGHLAQHRCVRFVQGDVTSFPPPPGAFDYVAHFGSTGSRQFLDEQPAAFFDLIVNGTRHVLDFAQQAGATRFLLASTGAVYGPLPPEGGVAEDYTGGPNPLNPASANAEAKRVAEFLALCAHRRRPAFAPVIARGFAFLGPYLPAEAGFAAYDFARDALAGRTIAIKGDGTPLRSYLYGSDLAIWLWTLLLQAPAGTAWNVGAEQPVSIRELAAAFAAAARRPGDVTVGATAAPGARPARYVPSTRQARERLGLKETVPLDRAVERTLQWMRNSPV